MTTPLTSQQVTSTFVYLQPWPRSPVLQFCQENGLLGIDSFIQLTFIDHILYAKHCTSFLGKKTQPMWQNPHSLHRGKRYKTKDDNVTRDIIAEWKEHRLWGHNFQSCLFLIELSNAYKFLISLNLSFLFYKNGNIIL